MQKRNLTYVATSAAIVLIIGLVWLIVNMRNAHLPHKLTDVPKLLFTINGGLVQLNHPMDTAIADNGSIYVSDSGNNQVQVFNTKGKFLFSFGEQENSGLELKTPYGLAILPNGTILVSDMLNHRIVQYSLQGKFLKIFLPASLGIKPGMLLATKNELFIADLAGNRVVAANFQGQILHSYNPGFSFPQGMAMINGKLAVADAGNNLVRLIDLASGAATTITGTAQSNRSFNILRGIAVDNLDRLLVVDSGASQVRFMTVQGKNLFTIGAPGKGAAQLQFPCGITVGAQGRIYIADWANNRVQVLGYGG
ncbi:MAG: hypothetical protein M0Z55_06865 [Peptococcaceae bacterium]|nr:hypothetical protein [Peptococcaceae bacterium]